MEGSEEGKNMCERCLLVQESLSNSVMTSSECISGMEEG